MSPSETPVNHPIEYTDLYLHISTLFEPTDHVEVRAFQIKRDGDGGGASHSLLLTAQRLLNAENDPPVAGWLAAHNTESWGLYVCVNPLKGARGSGHGGSAKDTDVHGFRFNFVDFDDATTDEALLRIKNAGLPFPTLVLASGSPTGTHAYYGYENAPDEVAWRGLQRRLIRDVQSDKAVKNPARVMRLAGTMNHKVGAGQGCRVVNRGEQNWYEDYTAVGIEPLEEESYAAPVRDADAPPNRMALNNTTRKFLEEPCPEGERNCTLFSSALDYNANNIPLDDAIKELADDRAIARDGFPASEAYRTVRNAYRREDAAPTAQGGNFVPPGGMTTTEWTAHINKPKGMPSNPEQLMMVEKRDAEPPAMSIMAEPIPTDAPLDVTGNVAYVPCDTPTEAPEADVPDVPEDVGESVDVPEGTVAVSVSTADQMLRPRIQNAQPETNFTAGGQAFTSYTHKTMPELMGEIPALLDGWPKRSRASGLFTVSDGGQYGKQIVSLADSTKLFGFFQDCGNVFWRVGEVKDSNGNIYSPPTKDEFFEIAKSRMGEEYIGTSDLPQYPPIPGMYYLPLELPEPTGVVLQEFLDALNPATEKDRQLLLAALLTPGWGGPAGARPMFVITSDHGMGSGKTETAKALGRIWGGATPIQYEDNWSAVCKSIMSSDGWLSKCFLFDNIKGRFGGAAIESAVTSDRISGHRMYHGTVERYNDATFYLTFNVPELTRDLAARSVIIKIGKQKRGQFVSWAKNFIEENQLQLVADLLALLRGPDQGEIKPENEDRWADWQRGVLRKVPGADVDALAAEICGRRPAVDGDADEIDDILRDLYAYLTTNERVPERDPGSTEPRYAMISSMEVYRIQKDGGHWRSSDKIGESNDRKACIKNLRAKIDARIFHFRRADGTEFPKVRVDADGRPVTHVRGEMQKRSVVYRIDLDLMEEALAAGLHAAPGDDPDPADDAPAGPVTPPDNVTDDGIPF